MRIKDLAKQKGQSILKSLIRFSKEGHTVGVCLWSEPSRNTAQPCLCVDDHQAAPLLLLLLFYLCLSEGGGGGWIGQHG